MTTKLCFFLKCATIYCLFFPVYRATLSEFPDGTVVIDQASLEVKCANCGFICGRVVDEYTQFVDLFSFRLTVDLPTDTIRVCQRRTHKLLEHRHHYLNRMTSLTLNSESDYLRCEQLYELNLYSQLWNNPFHLSTCRVSSPCVHSEPTAS